MLKAGGLSLEEVARATLSTVGAVKQKSHRAYERLRKLLEIRGEAGLDGGAQQIVMIFIMRSMQHPCHVKPRNTREDASAARNSSVR